MDYRKHYNLLIEKAKSRCIKDKNIYLEKHHIIPRSEGGDSSEDNLVLLFPREHFIAHWLLYRESPTISRSFAFNMMSCDRRGVYRASSRAYAEGVEAAAIACSENLKGRKVVRHPITNKAKYVRQEELDFYLEQGWTLGNKGFGTVKGKIWINNGKEERYSEEVLDGWVKGRLGTATKGKKAISKDGVVKYVDNVDDWIKKGWVEGNERYYPGYLHQKRNEKNRPKNWEN